MNDPLGPKECCGLFGCFGCPDAAEKVYYGLYALQHRGEESAGIASTDGESVSGYRGMGLVGEVFNESLLQALHNPAAIGHLRYSTMGSSSIVNAQPMIFTYSEGKVAIAHNGQLTNASSLRDKFEANGAIFQTTSDTEVIVHLMASPEYAKEPDGILHALQDVRGAFSLLLLTSEEMIGLRDPHGFRPLCLGEIDCGIVLASETCALDHLGGRYIRDIEPGEAVFINKDGVRSVRYCGEDPITPKFCILELIYFSRPDSRVYGQNVHLFREALGRKLAEEQPAEADIVVSVPEGGDSAAMGFSKQSGIPLERGFIRNHYIGRTFIQPAQTIRVRQVELKLNPVREVVAGKRVIVIDDSIVRGTTSRSRVKLLRQAGAEEVHVRITCPPHRFPCFYGIDFQIKKELIAAQHSAEEIAAFLDADSLGYLSVPGMLNCGYSPDEHYCAACFTGDYPVPVEEFEENLALD